MDIKEKIRTYALENAIKFDGKANPGNLVGKIISDHSEYKKKIKDLMPTIQMVVKEVNSLDIEEQKKELISIIPNYFDEQKELKNKRKEQRKELPELKNAKMGEVITRISPEPSKYNHLGHAVSFLLNYIYSLKYEGQCKLRFEDTNPEKSSEEYVEAMKKDVLDYLNIKVADTVFVSDHIDKYYEYAQDLIQKGHAYTCYCKDISTHRREMKDCPCRDKPKEKTLEEWNNMKKGTFVEGEITLRLKISMQHKNAVMRDPVIFRLSYANHYLKGNNYKVWPMYDFENAIEEGLMGITHVLRSNEFDSRIELQDHIRNLFGLPNPTVKQYARFNVTGAITQGREIRKLIESGDYIGWDDPRLVTLRALKRRGIVKEAYYELSKVIGMSKNNSNLDFSVIAAINRKLLDEKAKRFFFLHDYKKIIIKGAPNQDLQLDLHPHHMKGGRVFKVNDTFYLSKKDLSMIKEGELIRLMDCLNFRKKGKEFIFDSTEVEKYKTEGKKIIHWLPMNIKEIEILMPDNTTLKGIVEENITNVEESDVIQFERFAFCRLDNKNELKFWYTHE